MSKQLPAEVPEEAVMAAYEATGGSPLIRPILQAAAPSIRSQAIAEIEERLYAEAAKHKDRTRLRVFIASALATGGQS